MIHRTKRLRPLTARRGVEELIKADYPDQVDYWLGNDDVVATQQQLSAGQHTAKHTPITLRIEFPECGYKNVETISERQYLSNLLELKCFRCQIREQHAVTDSYCSENNMADTKCPFCDLNAACIYAENDTAVAIPDGFPIAEGHTLVVPRRHRLRLRSLS